MNPPTGKTLVPAIARARVGDLGKTEVGGFDEAVGLCQAGRQG